MGFIELVQDRYSVREFSDKKISDEQLEMILDAGRLAPTACNYQPQRIYVLKSPESLKKIRELTPMTYGAPVVLLICHDKNTSWKAEKFDDPFDAGEMDATIVATMMMLEAADLGIGSLWARGFNREKIEKAFDLPDNVVLDLMLDLGYPADTSKASDLHKKRLGINETVFEI